MQPRLIKFQYIWQEKTSEVDLFLNTLKRGKTYGKSQIST